MVKAFRIVEKGRLEEVEAEGVFGQGDAGAAAGQRWIDLDAPSADELLHWMEACGVPALQRDLALSPFANDVLGDQSSGALLADEGTYFFFPFYGRDKDTAVKRLSALCTPSALLTFHEAHLSALDGVQRLAREGDVLPSASVAGLITTLLRFAANRNVETATTLRKRSRELAERLAHGAGVALDEILELDSEVDTLGGVVDEQLVTVRALSVGNAGSLPWDGLDRNIAVVTTNLETLARALDRLDRHVESLRAQYDSMLAERTNRRLATLTVLSAVFMPLTLIAGIYGMNFDHMPELHMRGAYPMTLLAMAGIATGMLIFFKRRGWFS